MRNLRFLIASLTLLFPGAAVQAQESSSPAALALQEARSLAGRQRYVEAAELARTWLQEEPKGSAADGLRSVLCHAQADGGFGPEAADEDPLRVGGGVSRPELLHKEPAEYTEVARKARLQGSVIVEVVVDREGCVKETKVLKGLPMGLDKAAEDAAARYVFQPAQFHGRPLAVYYVMTINFHLE